MIRLALLILLLCSQAWGADVECGVDSDHNGTITLCSNADKDRDGFTVAQGDCDDEDKNYYPGRGRSTGCSANEAKNCPISGTGTETACSSGGWKPEGCTNAYYIAATGGNNSNSGAVGSPWANYLKFVTYYDPGTEAPAGHRDPESDDCFIFRTGTYSNTYSYNGTTVGLFIRNQDGAGATDRIIITAFPGETVNIGTNVNIFQSDYFDVIGLTVHDITAATSSLLADAVALAYHEGTGGKLDGNTVYNIDGSQLDNLAGVYAKNAPGAKLTNNLVYDVYDRAALAGTGGTGRVTLSENNSGILYFSSSGIRIARNQVLDSNTGRANCIKGKHRDETATDQDVVDWNICYKADGALGYALAAAGSTHYHHNLVFGLANGSASLAFRDYGGPTNFSDPTLIEYNDFRTGGITYQPSKEYTANTFETFTTRYNIIVDNRSSGYVLNFCDDGSNAYYTDLITGSKVLFNNNCYDISALSTFPVSIFGANDGSASLCGSGAATSSGTAYTAFSGGGGWNETGAVEIAPNFDSNGVPQAETCQAMGRFASSSDSGTPATKRKGQQNFSGRKGQ